MDKVNLSALQTFIRKLKISQWTTTVKLIHGWVPTYVFLCWQGRVRDAIFPSCKSMVETRDHVFCCPSPSACDNRLSLLKQFLRVVLNIGTPVFVISTLAYKLMLTLHLPISKSSTRCESLDSETILWLAIQHQNIIGWDNFLRGYISQYWASLHQLSHPDSPPRQVVQNWNVQLSIMWYPSWKEYGLEEFHGGSWKESKQKLRERVQEKVWQIYSSHHNLHRRYPDIHSVPLVMRLQQNTTSLQRWLHRIEHQSRISKYI